MFILDFLQVFAIAYAVSGLSAQDIDTESLLLKELQLLRNDFDRLEKQQKRQEEQMKELTQATERLETKNDHLVTSNKRLRTRNAILETRVDGLERELHVLKQTNEPQKQQPPSLGDIQSQIQRGDYVMSSGKSEYNLPGFKNLRQNESNVRKERGLESLSQSCCVSDNVAFYSYISHYLVPPSGLHTIIFDQEITNVGNAYNQYSGVFTAPRDGVYVFVWTIRLYKAAHSTELMVNQRVFGTVYSRENQGDDQSVTGVVVAQLSPGDVVFVRTHQNYNSGGIQSQQSGYSSFSGWKLN